MRTDSSDDKALVWDLPTRVFHWALAASFAGAYVLAENDGLRAIHVMFGYTVFGLVVFRLAWGFLGSRYARFESFRFGPGQALGYLRDLARGRARAYTGHNPAASWAIYLMLVLAAATAVTGWLHLNGVGGEALEETHEVLGNAWLALVAVHVIGVIVGSIAHRRNLVRTMITGYRQGESTVGVGQRLVIGLSVGAIVVAFWAMSLGGLGPVAAVPGAAVTAAGPDAGHDGHEDYDEDDD